MKYWKEPGLKFMHIIKGSNFSCKLKETVYSIESIAMLADPYSKNKSNFRTLFEYLDVSEKKSFQIQTLLITGSSIRSSSFALDLIYYLSK